MSLAKSLRGILHYVQDDRVYRVYGYIIVIFLLSTFRFLLSTLQFLLNTFSISALCEKKRRFDFEKWAVRFLKNGCSFSKKGLFVFEL